MNVQWVKNCRRGASNEKGAALVEYAMLAVLIAVVAFAAVALAGAETSQMYSTISDSVEAAAN